MCEVGPPAELVGLLHFPYSRYALNGHPALRGLPATAGFLEREQWQTKK